MLTAKYVQTNLVGGLVRFLPEDLNHYDMINITCLEDRFEKYLDKSGNVHDGAVYYAQYLAEERQRLRGY